MTQPQAYDSIQKPGDLQWQRIIQLEEENVSLRKTITDLENKNKELGRTGNALLIAMHCIDDLRLKTDTRETEPMKAINDWCIHLTRAIEAAEKG